MKRRFRYRRAKSKDVKGMTPEARAAHHKEQRTKYGRRYRRHGGAALRQRKLERARTPQSRAKQLAYREANRAKACQRFQEWMEKLKRDPAAYAAYRARQNKLPCNRNTYQDRGKRYMARMQRERPAAYRALLDRTNARRRELHAQGKGRYFHVRNDPVRWRKHLDWMNAKNADRRELAKLQDPRNALSLHARIKASVRGMVQPELLQDLVQELFAAVLMREIRFDRLTDRRAIKPYLVRVRKLMPDTRRQFSLNTAIPGADGLTYLDVLEAEAIEE